MTARHGDDSTGGAMALIAALGLVPHPEGGHYRETWRHQPPDGGRGAGTAILYLLRAGERSHWHRIDATEIWHFHAGAPLRLRLFEDGHGCREIVLGSDLDAGHRPQAVVPPGTWQAAEPLVTADAAKPQAIADAAKPQGAWTLVGCTVSPAFSFAGFELAPSDWSPVP